jgi:hypothetical protein
MKIRCILKRDDGTEVELGGQTYLFAPENKSLKPGTPEFLAADHVCDVTVADHVRRLLRISEAYEPVLPEDVPKQTAIVQAAATGAEDDARPTSGNPDIDSLNKLELAEFVTVRNIDVKLNLLAPLPTLRKQVAKALSERAAADAKAREVAALTAVRDEAKAALDAEKDAAKRAPLQVELDQAQADLDALTAD